MSTFFAQYPSSASSNASVGANGAVAPTSSTEVGGINPTGNLQPLQTNTAGSLIITNDPAVPIHVIVDSSALPTGASTSAKQDSQITQETAIAGSTASIDTKSTSIATNTSNTATSTASVDTKATTIATNTGTTVTNTGNTATSVASIDTKTPTVGQKTMAASSPVVIASDQSTLPVSAASLPLPAGAATETTLSSINTKTPSLGAAASSASSPVVIANDQGLSTAAVRSAVGSFTAAAQTQTINPSGASVVTFQLSGTFTGTVTFETSNDNGTTWSNLVGWDQGNVGFSATGNVSGRNYICPAYGNLVRARCSAYTSGTIVCTIIAGRGSMPATYVSPVTFFPVQGSAALAATGTGVQPLQVGGLFQTTPATLTNGQQGALQQDTAQNLLVNLKTALPTGANVVGAVTQSGTWTVQPGNTANTTAWLVAQKGLSSSNAPITVDYSGASITTSAYTQLIASTTSAATFIDIFDSSGQTMILATGAAASEVILAYVPPGGDAFSIAIPAGTRVAYKALTATASSGILLMNLRG